MTEAGKFFRFLTNHSTELWQQVTEHLMLTLTALVFAIVAGLFLGILITRKNRTAPAVLAVVNAFQTIPSVALLGFLLPFLGIGEVPAIVALFLYALLPIVRNTYTGIKEIDPAVKEAAVGMGMNNRQLLARVELPLAMPVIFAGIRTAFVISVGVATLCALIAAGGLGEFIFRGLSTNNVYMILAGAIPAALMALIFDALMGLLQKHIYKALKPLLLFFAALLIGIVVYTLSTATSDKIIAGFPSEFIERGDGYTGLKGTYGLDFEIKEMEIGLMYDAVNSGAVDVISGFSTDGRIKAYDLKVLEDDKAYFPPYHAAPLIHGRVVNSFPEVKSALNKLSGALSDKQMAELNYQVDQKQEDIEQVAIGFLKSRGWYSGRGPSATRLIVGSKNFTESFILAYLFKHIIESEAGIGVEVKLGFGGTKLLFDALNTREIDIYPEYTGTGLLVILPPDERPEGLLYQKDSVYQYVKTEFKSRYNIEWLKPLGFNNTFALMMKRNKAEKLEVDKISDLAK